MNQSIACVFPETLPDERFLAPLVQVFGQVVHLQAVENETPPSEAETALVRQSREQGRLAGFTPAPLGGQRQRFLALVQDMRRRGDTYLSQLGMLTLAGLNRREQPESRQSILGDLLRQSDIRTEPDQEQVLWQSRLIVKLGEMFDLEQAGLRQALEEISCRQDKMLAALCDDEDNPFVLTAEHQDPDQEADGILHHRLRAWTRLCFHDGNSAPGLLVTRHRTAVDLLQEVYEKRWQRSARRIASLDIPTMDDESALRLTVASQLAEQCPNLTMALAAMGAKTSEQCNNEAMEQLLKKGLLEWSQATAASDKPLDAATWRLELFSFVDASAATLFAESFVPDMKSPAPDGHPEGCVIGLLTMR